MKLLPHRYPFLLVDRITELDPGKRIVGLKNVTINEPFFQGHFPNMPVMPGVLIIECMAQVGGVLVFREFPERGKKLIYFTGIENARFRRPVVPGDQLRPLEAGGKIPHTYGPAEPCLFYPSRASWRSDMKLSQTIIPWLSLWLTFYEMWRATGKWHGGGISHGAIKELEPAA